jgi:hypothetical protein
VSASNFLIAYVRARSHIEDMENAAIVWKGRVTKQGLRDLNYYGPKREKGVAVAPVESNDSTTSKPTSSDEPGPTSETSATGQNT